MTREQAIAHAIRFHAFCLQKTGRKPARFEAESAQQQITAAGDIEPFWQVLGKDGSEVHINDKDGMPVGIFFIGVSKPNNSGPKGPVISGRELEVRARNYQRLFFAKAGQFSESPQFNRIYAQSAYRWTRMYKSIPFLRQECVIGLDSNTGELQVAALIGWTDLPTNDIGRVTEREAHEIALKQASEMYKTGLRVTKSERQIVEGNRFWIDRSARRLSETRFAWLVTIQATQEYGTWMVVGVDSQSREVVYGEIQQLRRG